MHMVFQEPNRREMTVGEQHRIACPSRAVNQNGDVPNPYPALLVRGVPLLAYPRVSACTYVRKPGNL